MLAEFCRDPEAALQSYREAARLAPDWPAPLLGVGRALMSVGNTHGAQAPLREALGLASGHRDARYLLGYALLLEGDVEGAAAQARWLQAHASESAAGFFLNGQIAQLDGRGAGEAAGSCYAEALARDRFHAGAAFGTAQMLSHRGQYVQAEQWARRVYDWGGEYGGQWAWRATLLLTTIGLECEEYGTAREWGYRGLLLEPDSAAVLANLGNVVARSEGWPAAVTYYRQAVEQDGELVGARVGLAMALQYTGELAEAEREFRVALQLDPHSGDALAGLIEVCRGMGRSSEIPRIAERYRAEA